MPDLIFIDFSMVLVRLLKIKIYYIFPMEISTSIKRNQVEIQQKYSTLSASLITLQPLLYIPSGIIFVGREGGEHGDKQKRHSTINAKCLNFLW
jgi:hypothetical protein